MFVGRGKGSVTTFTLEMNFDSRSCKRGISRNFIQLLSLDEHGVHRNWSGNQSPKAPSSYMSTYHRFVFLGRLEEKEEIVLSWFSLEHVRDFQGQWSCENRVRPFMHWVPRQRKACLFNDWESIICSPTNGTFWLTSLQRKLKYLGSPGTNLRTKSYLQSSLHNF